MQVNKLSNSDISYNVKFKAVNIPKDFNKEIENSLCKIKSDPEAKRLFAGLTALAGAAIAGLMAVADKNSEAKDFAEKITKDFKLDESNPIFSSLAEILNENTENIKENKNERIFDSTKAIEEVPEREIYLKITSYFPNLDKAYKDILIKHTEEPENSENEFTLKNIESFFEYVSDKDRLINMRDYIKTLDENAGNLKNIAKNISSTAKGDNSIMYYMVLLKGGKLSKEDINLWAESDNLNCDEFMMCKHLTKEQLSSINTLKGKYNNRFGISEIDSKTLDDGRKMHAYKLNFKEDVELKERLKTVKDVHEAIYGKNCFDASKDYSNDFMEHDIQSEMVDNILKDRRMEATYNFVKYVSPKSLKNYNFSAQQVKFLPTDGQTYKQIKNICSTVLFSLDFDNPKLKELCDILNDESIFDGLFETRHAKLRFITRIVLKDNPNPENLRESCKIKMDILKKEILDSSDKCYYLNYTQPKGSAPQFFIGFSELGNFVKVTLNSSGSIHTIYEDITKEAKLLESQEKEQ